jgi:hypothetical protein
MMDQLTKNYFDIQIDRLESVFGERAFSGERCKLIWRAVERLSWKSFERICDHLIASCRHAPLPKDFADAVRAEIKNQPRAQKEDAPYVILCECCLDSGVCQARGRRSEQVYFIRCTCEVGEKSHHIELPMWVDTFADVFERRAIDHTEWKPNRFDPNHPIASIQDKVNLWRAKMRASKAFWAGET